MALFIAAYLLLGPLHFHFPTILLISHIRVCVLTHGLFLILTVHTHTSCLGLGKTTLTTDQQTLATMCWWCTDTVWQSSVYIWPGVCQTMTITTRWKTQHRWTISGLIKSFQTLSRMHSCVLCNIKHHLDLLAYLANCFNACHQHE